MYPTVCALSGFVYHVQFRRALFVHSCRLFQTQKTLKKPVDKAREKCYNRQAVAKQGTETGQNEEYHKKVEKLLENLLTRGGTCDILFRHFLTERMDGEKFFEKLFKNHLTSVMGCGIIVGLSKNGRFEKSEAEPRADH